MVYKNKLHKEIRGRRTDGHPGVPGGARKTTIVQGEEFSIL